MKVVHKLFGASNIYASIQLQTLLKNIESGSLANGDLEQAFFEVHTELNQIIMHMKKLKI